MTDRGHILPDHDVRPYSVPRLAERWGCSDSLVRKLIYSGDLQSFRIGNLIRVPAAEVERYEAIPAAPETEAPPISTSPPTAPAVGAIKRNIPRAKRRTTPLVINKHRVVPRRR